MEFNEKELRREISYAIKNIHGIRQVHPYFQGWSQVILTCGCADCWLLDYISNALLPIANVSSTPSHFSFWGSYFGLNSWFAWRCLVYLKILENYFIEKIIYFYFLVRQAGMYNYNFQCNVSFLLYKAVGIGVTDCNYTFTGEKFLALPFLLLLSHLTR